MRESDFSQLAIEAKLLAFRAAVDEHYRYHQFYGATLVVLPFFYAGLIYHSPARWLLYLILSPFFAAMEYALYWAAVGPYRAFVSRANFILKKEPTVLKEQNDV